MRHRHCLGALRRRSTPANANCASNTKKSASIAPPPPLGSLLVLLLSSVGVLARLAPAGRLARLSSVIFKTNASLPKLQIPPPITGCNAFAVGKSSCACPVA